jgi:hypothetical protein
VPFKPSQISAFRREQTFPENHRRNFLPGERGKIPREFRAPRRAAHTRKNVEQFPALAADDRLHLAIQPAVRAAGNAGAILALRTFKKKRLAHGLQNLAGTENFFKSPCAQIQFTFTLKSIRFPATLCFRFFGLIRWGETPSSLNLRPMKRGLERTLAPPII